LEVILISTPLLPAQRQLHPSLRTVYIILFTNILNLNILNLKFIKVIISNYEKRKS